MTDAAWVLDAGTAAAFFIIATIAAASWWAIRCAGTPARRRLMRRLVAVVWLVPGAIGALAVLAVAGLVPPAAVAAGQALFFVALGPGLVLVHRQCRRARAADGVVLAPSPA